MYYLKKPFYAAIALFSLASLVHADSGVNVDPAHIDLGLEGLYVRANENTELYYNEIAAAQSNDVSQHFRDLKYRLGWGAYLGYTFESQADVRLSYRYLYSESDASGVSGVSTDSSLLYHAMNLDLGKTFSPIASLNLRPFLGVGYRNVRYKMDFFDSNNLALGLDRVYSVNSYSRFKGLGPRVGLDAVYNWMPYLGLVAGAAFTLPYGSVDANGGWSQAQSSRVSQDFTLNRLRDVKHVVTELDANIALRVTGDLSSSENKYFLELGYRVVFLWDAYSNPFNGIDIYSASQVSEYADPNRDTANRNVSFNGPYVKVGVSF